MGAWAVRGNMARLNVTDKTGWSNACFGWHHANKKFGCKKTKETCSCPCHKLD